MSRFAALFRGINVGRAKRVPMADLRALMVSLGYTNVRTLLNSGNAVFEAEGGMPASHARRIREAVAKDIGVTAEVVVLSAARLGEIVADNPLLAVATDPSRHLVVIAHDPTALSSALATLAGAEWTPDVLAVGKQAAYLWCAAGILESKLAQAVGRQLGESATTRNWATVGKIQALLHF